MVDANKTELTKCVTEAAAVWLSERGFRPVESEVPCGRGWVADVASFCYPTRTEARKLKLLRKQPSWFGDAHDAASYRAERDARNAAYHEIPAPLTALVEVKTSVQDFKRDSKFERPAPVHLMYVAMPLKLAGTLAVNERWGILAYDAAGRVRLVRKPALQSVDSEAVAHFVAQVAIRRDAFTQYERWREFARQARESNNERIASCRVSRAVAMVLAISSGKMTAEVAVPYHLGKVKLPSWEIDELRKLEPSLTPEFPAMEPHHDH